ncbi:MAG: hypothetical protein HUU28_15840 [Planctomycetaceae bacterium]|nr:hypothetical protein [Planctomycetaceae bacterium]
MGGWWIEDESSEREIDAELEFHVAEATDEFVAAGVPREEARARALAQLGDIERWRAECLRHRSGRKTMLVKLQWAVIALLVGALGATCLRWQQERESHALQLEGAFSDLTEARAALEDAQVARAVGESLARTTKSHDGRAIQVELVDISQLDRREIAGLAQSAAALSNDPWRLNLQWFADVDVRAGLPARRYRLRMVGPQAK